MKQVFAREWLWLVGCLLVGTLAVPSVQWMTYQRGLTRYQKAVEDQKAWWDKVTTLPDGLKEPIIPYDKVLEIQQLRIAMYQAYEADFPNLTEADRTDLLRWQTGSEGIVASGAPSYDLANSLLLGVLMGLGLYVAAALTRVTIVSVRTLRT